jgi:chromosome segregation ATPase
MTSLRLCVTVTGSFFGHRSKLRQQSCYPRQQVKSQYQSIIDSYKRLARIKDHGSKQRTTMRTPPKLEQKLNELEEEVRDAELQRMREVEAAREAAEKEIEEYKNKLREEYKNDKERQKKSAQQQNLIDESTKIIEYLRKELAKLKGQNENMRKDFKALKENNQKLMGANASASASFTALNDHAKQLNVTNADLIRNVEEYKHQLEKLKEDLKTRQSYYLSEAEARLAYQKTLAQIVGTIQEKCKDAKLVEDVVLMALECESESKDERAAAEAGKESTG